MNDFSYQILGENPATTARHKIAGTVTVDGVPAKRLVMAMDRRFATLIASTFSDRPEVGAWSFEGLPEYPERALIVVALDTTGNYNAEVADYISQVATAAL